MHSSDIGIECIIEFGLVDVFVDDISHLPIPIKDFHDLQLHTTHAYDEHDDGDETLLGCISANQNESSRIKNTHQNEYHRSGFFFFVCVVVVVVENIDKIEAWGRSKMHL